MRVFVLGVASGYIALRFEELLREEPRLAPRGVASVHFKTAIRLAERRLALADAAGARLWTRLARAVFSPR